MIKIENRQLKGSLDAISSKSMAHRYLFCSALSDSETLLYLPDISEDIQITINCLKTLGAKIEIKEDYLLIKPIDKTKLSKEIYSFDLKESGTTLRFLLPIASTLVESSKFTGSGRLPARPIKELLQILKKSNCILSSDNMPFEIINKFKFKDVSIVGNISSQYISGLLLASPLQDEDININVLGNLESKPYVDMTIQVMKEYGVYVNEAKNNYSVNKTYYKSPKKAVVEGDWSNMAFFLVAGAISENPINISGLNLNSLQGDKKILEILKSFGANISMDKSMITVSKNILNPLEIDISDIPDLLPILAVLSAKAIGKTRFYNAGRLRFKESDRLKSTSNMIKNLGGNSIEKDDELIIIGSGKLNGGSVDSYNDHRIAMSASIASIICKNPVILKNEKSVNKSYSKFYKDFESLGGSICHL